MLFLTGFLLQAQNTLEVSMAGFENNDGKVLVGLYNTEGDFLEKIYQGTSSEIVNNKATVTFSDVPDGVYAISCFHDEDDNGKFNMLFGFIPTESFGTSNNAPAMFGPPKWEDAKFEVKNNQKLKFNIKL